MQLHTYVSPVKTPHCAHTNHTTIPSHRFTPAPAVQSTSTSMPTSGPCPPSQSGCDRHCKGCPGTNDSSTYYGASDVVRMVVSCTVLYCAVPCCTLMYLDVPCCTLLYLAVRCCTLLYAALVWQKQKLQSTAVLCELCLTHQRFCTLEIETQRTCCTVLYRAVPCCTLMCLTVPCCMLRFQRDCPCTWLRPRR